MYRFLLLLLILQFSCDDQSNPFFGAEYLENLGYESRDVLVLNDIELEILDCISLEQDSCIDDMWCNWDGDQCINVSNDLLIVANQYEEGLIIYDINTSETGISLDEIYVNNNFEVINYSSTENDLEIRQLVYDENLNMLYVLDKFEYIYQVWLPTLLGQSSPNIDNVCYDYQFDCTSLLDQDLCSNQMLCNWHEDECVNALENELDGIWDPIEITTFTEIGKTLHATQLVMDRNNPGEYEIIYLLKYNVDISSDSNIPSPSKTSCSRLGAYYFQLDPDALGVEAACNADFIATASDIDMSPLFDYGVTDIYKNNDIVIVANTYDSYVFKDELGEDLNITYFEGDVQDGCELPNNSIRMSNNGKLLYNISSYLNYFEFNLFGIDLSEYYYPEIANNYYYQYPSSDFDGLIQNYSDVAISISGNKVLGYVAPSGVNISPGCGTLIDLNLNHNDDIELIKNNNYSISIYNYTSPDNYIEFDYDIKTNAKPVSVYNNEEYLITGLDDDGCYITLLGDNGQEMTKFGCDNFTVNDIVYDDVNNKLLLSCGNDGVLIYHWTGSSMNPVFQNHIISSFAYKAKIYVGEDNNTYVIIATEYGLEIYSL